MKDFDTLEEKYYLLLQKCKDLESKIESLDPDTYRMLVSENEELQSKVARLTSENESLLEMNEALVAENKRDKAQELWSKLHNQGPYAVENLEKQNEYLVHEIKQANPFSINAPMQVKMYDKLESVQPTIALKLTERIHFAKTFNVQHYQEEYHVMCKSERDGILGRFSTVNLLDMTPENFRVTVDQLIEGLRESIFQSFINNNMRGW